MTTSNPVVPRLGTAIQPGVRSGQTAFHKSSSPKRVRPWLLSDFASIAVIVFCLRHLSASILFGNLSVLRANFPLAPVITALVCTSVFWMLGVYSPSSSPLNVLETERILRGMSVIAVLAALVTSPLDRRSGFGIFMLSAAVVLLLLAQRGFVSRLYPSRYERIRTLIYARALDNDLFKIIQAMSGHTIELVGLLYDSPWELSQDAGTVCRFAGTLDELKRVAKQTGASQVLIVGCDTGSIDHQRILRRCERLRLQCSVLMDPRTLCNSGRAYTFMHELPILNRQRTAVQAPFVYLKRAIDLILGCCLLTGTLPIAFVIAIVIKYDSSGPVFFRQQRIGKDGHPFGLLKFRTMHTWSPKYHRSPTSNCDSRITGVGRLIRRLSLDELPQLLNVLKGDMSLVGPRPEMPFIVDQYNDAARARLAVLPGITGLWQISRARSLPIHHNLQYDLFYIERQNIFLDIAILLRTLGAVVRGIGAA